MPLYLFSGNDGSSDNGYFDIIVRANTKKEAKKIVKGHLEDMGKQELFKQNIDCEMLRSFESGVIYSTVEVSENV